MLKKDALQQPWGAQGGHGYHNLGYIYGGAQVDHGDGQEHVSGRPSSSRDPGRCAQIRGM